MQDFEPALAYCKRAQVIATALEMSTSQVLVNQEMGIIYFELGEYRQAMECLQQNLTALQGERHHQFLGSTGAPSVQTRTWMVRCLIDLGEFADGVAYCDEALQIAEAVDRPFERLAVYSRIGYLHVRQGTSAPGHPAARTGGGLESGGQTSETLAYLPRIWRWPTPWLAERRTPSPCWGSLGGTRRRQRGGVSPRRVCGGGAPTGPAWSR